MSFLRDLPTEFFIFALFVVLALTGILIGTAIWSRRTAGAINAATPVDVSDLSAGYRMVQGKTTGPTVKAPLTGRPCVWWELTVWQQTEHRSSDGKKDIRWEVIRSETAEKPVRLTDGKSTCEIDADGATIVPSAWSRWGGQAEAPRGDEPELRPGTENPSDGMKIEVVGKFGNKYRYMERYIWTDEPLFALGAATVKPGAKPGSDTAARRAAWVIDKEKGKPFLVSTSPPDQLAGQMEMASKAAIPFGLVFAALAAFMLWARFGG